MEHWAEVEATLRGGRLVHADDILDRAAATLEQYPRVRSGSDSDASSSSGDSEALLELRRDVNHWMAEFRVPEVAYFAGTVNADAVNDYLRYVETLALAIRAQVHGITPEGVTLADLQDQLADLPIPRACLRNHDLCALRVEALRNYVDAVDAEGP